MKVYLVRKYVNNRIAENEYGVDDSYTLIGIFTREATAQKIKAHEEKDFIAKKDAFLKHVQNICAKKKDEWVKTFPNVPFAEEKFYQKLLSNAPALPKIDILEVELDKQYADEEELYLGGGTYIELW